MLNKYSKMLAFLLALVFIVSCSDDDSNDPNTNNEAETLLQYIESTSDYVNTYAPAMITAEEVNTLNATGAVYIIDVRAAADYAKGHIKNAVNVPLADLLTHLEGMNTSQYQKIAVVCYSGQSASWGTSLMRMMGYDNIFTMKFGMCSWSTETMGSWPGNIGNARAAQFVTEAFDKNPMGAMPELNTGMTTGEDILRTRVQAVLAEGYTPARVSHDDVFAALDNYYIVNYWKEAHYNDPGHIPGAAQYTPKEDLAYDKYIKTLPTDKPVVVYCYTGQTSSHVSAFLRVLGYDAKSLLFGANGMIYNEIDGKEGFTVWHDSYCMGYDLVTD
jgi:rhodanese-related sulfurtransferase